MVKITFPSREDSIKGFYKLMTSGRVRCLPNDVYEISKGLLNILEDSNIPYKLLNESKVEDANKDQSDMKFYCRLSTTMELR